MRQNFLSFIFLICEKLQVDAARDMEHVINYMDDITNERL